jgi:predicted O-linked N-acetylglucosamine transferase (SPINDLY family)
MTRAVTAADREAQLLHGFALHQQGRLEEAGGVYRQVLQIEPQNFDALHLLGLLALQREAPEHAVQLIGAALRVNSQVAAAHLNHGAALARLQRYEAALASYDQAIALAPNYADAYFNRANVLQQLKRYTDAAASYERAAALRPVFAEAHHNRGRMLHSLEQYQDAVASYDQAIALRPDWTEARFNRAESLHALRQYEAAADGFGAVLALSPDNAAARCNRGVALYGLRRYAPAAAELERAIALNGNEARYHHNYGLAIGALGRHAAAAAAYQRAILLKPEQAHLYNDRAVALVQLKDCAGALASYERALALEPDLKYLRGSYWRTRMYVCDWRDFEAQVGGLTASIERGEAVSPPFALLPCTDSPALQQRAAQIWVREECAADPALGPLAKRPRHSPIHLGYFSADFRDHATMYLIAGLFEMHDRSRFRVSAFSLAGQARDATRRRVAAACDTFVDVSDKSDREAAALARRLELDIAVDLQGFTEGSRTGIFAARAAPLQVSYLGYPGTLGTDYMDYLVADATLVPASSQAYYTEKIVYLPDSYQVNDSRRGIAERSFSRAELGLPASGFVFCCFNNSYKITPEVFTIWMRLLTRVPGSVLWLLQDNETAPLNLRREAQARGVDGERLVFAPRWPLAEHLARQRAADLFLDTFPCNAHTTASDALWAGLPVLTRMGESFAARVAASLLRAIGLPELITSTAERYEALALELASDAQRLGTLTERLRCNRLTTSLFDTRRFTTQLEEAYTQMYERYQAGLAPEHLYLRPAAAHETSSLMSRRGAA